MCVLACVVVLLTVVVVGFCSVLWLRLCVLLLTCVCCFWFVFVGVGLCL